MFEDLCKLLENMTPEQKIDNIEFHKQMYEYEIYRHQKEIEVCQQKIYECDRQIEVLKNVE